MHVKQEKDVDPWESFEYSWTNDILEFTVGIADDIAKVSNTDRWYLPSVLRQHADMHDFSTHI